MTYPEYQNLLKYIIFADDASVVCTTENIQQLSEVVNTEMKKSTTLVQNQ